MPLVRQATITVVLGSSNREGNTKRLVDRVFIGDEASMFNLGDYSFSDWDYDAQNLEDDFQVLASKLTRSTDIVFATPVYWYAMSAQMKRFFDRFSDLITRRKALGRSLAGKRTWLLATGSDPELPTGFTVPFQRTSEYFHMKFCGALYTQMNDSDFKIDIISQIENFRTKIISSSILSDQ